MKAWQETTRVYDEIARLAAAGRKAALATLVKIEGSSYRRPGAKLLIRDDGSMLGNVSGGCLEEDLRERALKVMRTGRPEMVHYETGGDENVVWGLGLGCDGKLDLLIQPCPPGGEANLVSRVQHCLEGHQPFSISTALDGENAGRTKVDEIADLSAEKLSLAEKPGGRVFVDVLKPPADLVILGAGDDAVPLVRIAADAGFRIILVDHRSAYLTEELFPGARRMKHARPENGVGDLPAGADTLVVVKSHALALDRAWTNQFLATLVRYIGLLGPKARREEILKQVPADQRHRIYGPIGLDVGAEGAEQVALSIVTELLAVCSGRAAGHLRDRAKPLHA